MSHQVSAPPIQTTPAVASLVAILAGLVAAVQFSVPTSQTIGIATLYLWPIAIGALWFGVRVGIAIVVGIMLVQAAWYATVPHALSAGGGLLAVGLRGATYLFIACLVGEFAARLRRAALTDALTKLPNRRAFFEEARRRGHITDRLGIVMADVDGLKQINDRDGHEAGDDAIISTGRALVAYLGRDAFVCRFGGDEFLALTDLTIIDRIKEAQDPVPGVRLGTAFHVTTADAPIDDAIAAADQALYTAKTQLRAA
jgi:diguanylate cyclase (GGDEF)-like protein